MDNFWEIEGWERSDAHLVKLKEMPFQRAFPTFSWKKGLYVLRGPRQVGKTSWLKSLLFEHSKTHAKDCYYLSCENVRDHLDLAQILSDVQKKKWIFLDEITFVSEWARAVKHAWDSGKLHGLVLTGSNAHDLRRGGERMPGRISKANELTLLPMALDEFTQMRQQAGWIENSPLETLKKYFKIGGFPLAVAESGKEGLPPTEAWNTYRNWLIGDFTKLGKQESYLREVLLQLCKTMGTPLSLQKLATRTQIASHHTVLSYLQTLEDCYALRTLYALDSNTGALRFKKKKKFYFTDPLLYWMALDWGAEIQPHEYEPALAEMVAHEFLARNYNRFGYHQSNKEEVDFYLKDRWAIEVKWSAVVTNLSEAYKNIQVPRKWVWNQTNFLNRDNLKE